MDEPALFECWSWLSKRGDDYEGIVYDSNRFKKRKKRWITVCETSLLYSKAVNTGKKRTDAKTIPLEHLTAIKSFNESNLETMVFLVDSQSRNIQVVLEPENFSRDVPLLLAAILAACSYKRRNLTQLAIQNCDTASLASLLAYHTSNEAILQDDKFSSYGTPLHFVLHYPENLQCLPLVMDKEAMMHSRNSMGHLPIHSAVRSNDLSVVKRLVEVASWTHQQGGAELTNDCVVNLRTGPSVLSPSSPDTTTGNGGNVAEQTPLHLSTDEEMTALLLSFGARVDAKDNEGNTPLLLSCAKGLYFNAMELLDAGACVNDTNWKTGLTPVMLIADLCNSCDSEQEDDESMYTLFKELMDRNACCDVLDNNRMSALHYACLHGDLRIISSLLQTGVDIDGQDVHGATPLCYAASLRRDFPAASSHEICGLLIARGSYPWIRDCKGRQAIHYAAGCGNADTLAMLLDIGQNQDVNTLCYGGFTALDYVNTVLRWLDSSVKSGQPSFFDDFRLSIPDESAAKLCRQKYDRSKEVLKSRGALERRNEKAPVEQNCRDMIFEVARDGAYFIAAASPYAFLYRLTSFLFYEKDDAQLMLLTYKSYLTPRQLLCLCKIRFFFLLGSLGDALEACSEEAFGLGVVLVEPAAIAAKLVSLEVSRSEGDKDKEDLAGEEAGELTSSRREETTGPKTSARYVKGVESTLAESDDKKGHYVAVNSCIGRVFSEDLQGLLSKFIESILKTGEGVDMMEDSLLCQFTSCFAVLRNISFSQSHKDQTSWTWRFTDSEARGALSCPALGTAALCVEIKSVCLRCKPAHKMMRGKARYELEVSFQLPFPASGVTAEDLEALKETLCSALALALHSFSGCGSLKDGSSKDLTPRLSKKESFIESLSLNPPKSDARLAVMSSLQRQVLSQENAYNGISKADSKEDASNSSRSENTSEKMSSTSSFIQFLALWCSEFYEDDFESDDDLRVEMGAFVETVFQRCGVLIEKELDPNRFSSFLGLEKSTEQFTEQSAEQGSKLKQNKRQSKAVQQSKRLSKISMIDAAPQLRGGLYEGLFLLGRRSPLEAIATTESDFSLLDSSAERFAEQWTLLEHYLYCRVRRSEFTEAAAEDRPESHLFHLKRLQWHMMDWCISQVVGCQSVEVAQRKVTFLLEVCACLETFRNFNGMFEIYTILQTSSVFRLKEVWSALSKASLKRKEALDDLFNVKNGFSNFRHQMAKLDEVKTNPAVPYLGIYLKDLVHIKQLPDVSPANSQLVNMVKMTSLSAKLLELHSFQQVEYHFAPDFPLISNMLSRPKHASEESQYKASLELYPA